VKGRFANGQLIFGSKAILGKTQGERSVGGKRSVWGGYEKSAISTGNVAGIFRPEGKKDAARGKEKIKGKKDRSGGGRDTIPRLALADGLTTIGHHRGGRYDKGGFPQGEGKGIGIMRRKSKNTRQKMSQVS